jgi:hypothetical protein
VRALRWRQADEPTAKPLPDTAVVDPHCQHEPEPLPQTDVANSGPDRGRDRARVYHIYPTRPSNAELHARELLASIQQHAPEGRGDYVPQAELERYYNRDLCRERGWEPLHWVAIARRLRSITDKRVLRENGERFVGYRVPE